MRKLWSLTLMPVYLYVITILTQYGYNAYFNIPSNFIQASIKENTIYYFQLFQIASGIAGYMRLWMWFVIITVALGFIFLFFFHRALRAVLVVMTMLLLLYILGPGSYNFGNLLAKSTTIFYAPASGCISADNNTFYIIPTFYGSKAVLVPVDANTKRISGSFIIKETSELQCPIELKEVGKIEK